MTDHDDNKQKIAKDGYLRRMFATDIASDLAEGRVLELAEIYALDALSDAERAEIDHYLATAPERSAFLDRVRQTRETLATAFTDEAEPRAGLLQGILLQLPDQARVAPAPSSIAEASASAPTPAATEPSPGVVDLATARDRRDRRRFGGVRGWVAAAAAAAVIALGGVGVGVYVAGQNDPVNQVLQASDVRQATVNVNGGGTATVSISSSKNAVVVRMNGVPAPPAGKVYQMWLIPKDGSDPVSQGLMDAEALSHPTVVSGISSATAIGITVEPEGGSKKPTLPTVAAAPLTS
ncbi:anti-sigma factor domain-containing protein [Arthrobacter sp. AZCC_0090]|uniref:anti-sigma factor n=1 Tax=Arthrobacter sp. AZCC_0090 TaxID=2735881 RepID=UPI00161844CB|nr:anti-sigma factor [Arthrobacter sp. AZCC_0090]MBB6403879.1 anti-sigma-K factor RskA [Arthrobacter sp. AZCC_0090]